MYDDYIVEETFPLNTNSINNLTNKINYIKNKVGIDNNKKIILCFFMETVYNR